MENLWKIHVEQFKPTIWTMKTKKMTSYTTTEFFIVHGFATVSMEHSFKTMYVSPKIMVIFFFAKHSYTIFYLKTVY